jgi:hypothetical protein
MQPTVALSALFEFYGTDATTITTNGGATGSVQFYVAKSGSGSVTLLDNWINNSAQSSINFVAGSLNLSGRTVTCRIFVSNNNNTRNLDISNATITTNLRWIYLGANKQLTAAGSHLTSHATFQINAPNSSYPWIDLSEINRETGNDFSITGATIGQLTFTNTSPTALGRINSSNTIRRLEYKGSGFIGNAGNNIDSLIFAGSRNYVLVGTNTIQKYFKAEALTCGGLTEIRGSGIATLAFQPAAEVHVANVYLQNMTATGIMTPIAFNGADAGGNTGWTINSAAAGSRYWVGGSGDWNDPNHWSATSGGAGGACVPTVYDDVYFNAASGFTAVSKTVTVNNGNAYCRNIDWTGAANGPIWSKAASWTVEVWGDVILNPAATFNVSPITLKGGTAAFMTNQVLGDFDVTIDKPGSGLTLLNDYNNVNTSFALNNGAFNAPGRVLNVSAISNGGANTVSSINIDHSVITATFWNYSGTIANHTLNAADSKITTAAFTASGLTYNVVNVTGILSTSAVLSSATVDSLTFTNTNTVSAAGINGTNNILNIVDYKGAGAIYGSGNSIDTLIFFPGNTYTLTAGTNTTITGEWYGSGTPCKATEIVSSSPSSNATITKNNGDVNFDYVRLRRITAAGSAGPFRARSHSTDLGNNVNWNIAPYNGAEPIYGLGPDMAVLASSFPIVLHTDGFFGSPSSQYTWNDNSTADSLEITGTGTYSVTVSFPDGCSISDAITVALSSTLPVTLVDFAAKANGCQTQVRWKVADAINFSHFEVERSSDGLNFTPVADLPYSGNTDYSYTDMAPENGTNYYRLRLVDIDAHYTYSKTVAANTSCNMNLVKVYPTFTTGKVQVVLPQGYESAKIYLVNAAGQRIIPLLLSSTGTVRSVSLEGLPAATYVLQVVNDRETKSFKIVKQ